MLQRKARDDSGSDIPDVDAAKVKMMRFENKLLVLGVRKVLNGPTGAVLSVVAVTTTNSQSNSCWKKDSHRLCWLVSVSYSVGFNGLSKLGPMYDKPIVQRSVADYSLSLAVSFRLFGSADFNGNLGHTKLGFEFGWDFAAMSSEHIAQNKFERRTPSSSFYSSVYSEVEEVGWENLVKLDESLAFVSFRIK
ncbi:hypothetical protein Scep_001287 [Stephania cephalantha]|uniref:Uncharacterized protein n=1 Tax=Stephania cephalantha TaxID=152367 RepID=A0AAP0L834_9MAGN